MLLGSRRRGKPSPRPARSAAASHGTRTWPWLCVLLGGPGACVRAGHTADRVLLQGREGATEPGKRKAALSGNQRLVLGAKSCHMRGQCLYR